MSTVKIVSDVCHGQLLKWTNYMKGYRQRWFLLQNGFLSYYKSDSETIRQLLRPLRFRRNMGPIMSYRPAEVYNHNGRYRDSGNPGKGGGQLTH